MDIPALGGGERGDSGAGCATAAGHDYRVRFVDVLADVGVPRGDLAFDLGVGLAQVARLGSVPGIQIGVCGSGLDSVRAATVLVEPNPGWYGSIEVIPAGFLGGWLDFGAGILGAAGGCRR